METVNTVSSSPSVRQEGQAFPVNVGGPTNGFPHDVPSHANPKTAAPISMSRDSLGVPSILPTSNMTNPSTLTGGEGVQPMLLNGIDLPKSSALSSLAGVQTAEGKRQREREKRIMPARLQRVSNLLAGSTIEDELSGTNAKQEAHLLPPETKVVLYTCEDVGFATCKTEIKGQEGSLFATPVFVNSCRAREMIETPDFKFRDDTEMMGKTRTIRSDEDTSDAAYERRHRKPDNVEKKQRRLEKEGLVRDRQKLKERIDQLRVADARLLVPILTARELHQKQTEGENVSITVAAPAASPGEGEIGGTKPSLGIDAVQSMAKLELLRTELLEEAHETLKRYDALLTPTEPTVPNLMKRKASEGGADEADHKPVRSISLSGAFATKNGQGTQRSASTSKVKKSAKGSTASPAGTRAKRLSLVGTVSKEPQPFKPEDGTVRAENTYANIHARTSGGRFAPKSLLTGAGGSTSKINTKGKTKSEEGKPKPKRARSSAGSSKARTKITPNSLIESVSNDNKPKRVKITFNQRKKASLGLEAGNSSSTSTVDPSALKEDEEEEEEDVDDHTIPQRAARAALTLEEAQALLAKAMEDDDDEEDEEIKLEVKPEDGSTS